MIEGSNELWAELSAMADAFANLGRVMLAASRQLHNPGMLPQRSIDHHLAALRIEFETLRDRIGRLASELGVEVPSLEDLEDLKALAELLEEVGEYEDQRESRRAVIARALSVLDRVLSLEHSLDPEFSALRECQEQARTLHAAIDAGSDETLDEQVTALAELEHPYAYLITMVEGHSGATDDLWEHLFESVAGAFGRTLAAAVARSKIVLRPKPVVVSIDVSPPPHPAFFARPGAYHEPVVAFPRGSGRFRSGSMDWGAEAATRRAIYADAEPTNSDRNGSEDILTSVVAEVIPFMPRNLATLLARRQLGQATRYESAPAAKMEGR